MNLRRIFFLFLALNTAMGFAQRKPRIKGSRVLTEIREELAPYHSITLLDDLEIVLARADHPGYEIEADDNLIDILKFEVKSDTLFISSFYTVTAKRKLEIRILYNDIRNLTLKDGKIGMTDMINSGELNIHTLGHSRLQLRANTDFMQLRMEDQSTADLNLESDSLTLDLSGRVDARIYQVSDHLRVSMSDASDVNLDGTVSSMEVSLRGNADLKAERLEAETVYATMADASSMHIHANILLELSSSGTANTYLYGDAKINIRSFTDTSELYKRTN